LALIINAIDPKIGGVLVRGPKGSGKTTTVRALADILPPIKVVKGCPFNCNPEDPSNMCDVCRSKYERGENLPVEEKNMVVVDLPLGATEDRVIGSLDVEKAIKYGIEALEPGILAEANQNILYVDEINLLPDHVADDLLDAAATGWNVVEREGISVKHPSRFIFIGTMNPEEGELRPQLLDRFPLSVSVENVSSVEERMEIVKRNLEFEKDPEGFRKKYKPLQEELKKRIIEARRNLEEVIMPDNILKIICKACLELKVDGMRPDIVISKAARALAAFHGRKTVTLEDALIAAELALSHRTREGGFREPASPEHIRRVFMRIAQEVGMEEYNSNKKSKEALSVRESKESESVLSKLKIKLPKVISQKNVKKNKSNSKACDVDEISKYYWAKVKDALSDFKPLVGGFRIPKSSIEKKSEGKSVFSSVIKRFTYSFKSFFRKSLMDKRIRRSIGRRVETITSLRRGRPWSWKLPKGKPKDVHLPATIRAAARKQKFRSKPEDLALKIEVCDVREKLRIYKAPMTVIFVVDASDSMIIELDAVRETLIRLQQDVQRYRDKVGIVAFKNAGAVVVQYPTNNLRIVARKLAKIRVSGFTPLAAGMLKGLEVLEDAMRRNPGTVPAMIIVTDGGANVPLQKNMYSSGILDVKTHDVSLALFEDPAIRDVACVAKLIRRKRIPVVVVNTNPWDARGFSVTKMIASITGGTLHKIERPELWDSDIKFTTRDEMVRKVSEAVVSDLDKFAISGWKRT